MGLSEGALVGRLNMGGVRMRGVSLAKVFGWTQYHVTHFAEDFKRSNVARHPYLLLVKYDSGQGLAMRRACDRFLYDPLDCWMAEEPGASPDGFWKRKYRELAFDDILAATPSTAVTMRDALPVHVRVWFAPHHCDKGVDAGWYDPDGHVSYAGGLQYIKDQYPAIREACGRLGRKVIVSQGYESLKGSALTLALRLPPHETAINRLCKPQVKLENAAAARLPVLASNHECITSLRPECAIVKDDWDWEKAIKRALQSVRLSRPVMLKHHIRRMGEILEAS